MLPLLDRCWRSSRTLPAFSTLQLRLQPLGQNTAASDPGAGCSPISPRASFVSVLGHSLRIADGSRKASAAYRRGTPAETEVSAKLFASPI